MGHSSIASVRGGEPGGDAGGGGAVEGLLLPFFDLDAGWPGGEAGAALEVLALVEAVAGVVDRARALPLPLSRPFAAPPSVTTTMSSSSSLSALAIPPARRVELVLAPHG